MSMRSQTRRVLTCESLQDRCLLAGVTFADGVLTVEGTDNSDQIQVSQYTNLNGEVFIEVAAFPGVAGRLLRADDVTKIVVNGGCGNDHVEIAREIEKPTELNGGSGEDTILGGAGRDTIHGGSSDDVLSGRGGRDEIFGDAGNDRLSGGAFRDTLVGGPGNNRLDGGASVDLIVADDNDEVIPDRRDTVLPYVETGDADGNDGEGKEEKCAEGEEQSPKAPEDSSAGPRERVQGTQPWQESGGANRERILEHADRMIDRIAEQAREDGDANSDPNNTNQTDSIRPSNVDEAFGQNALDDIVIQNHAALGEVFLYYSPANRGDDEVAGPGDGDDDGAEEPDTDPLEKQVSALVPDLADSDWDSRKAATQTLIGLGVDALPFVIRALEGEVDLEAKRRLTVVVTTIAETAGVAAMPAIHAGTASLVPSVAELCGQLEHDFFRDRSRSSITWNDGMLTGTVELPPGSGALNVEIVLFDFDGMMGPVARNVAAAGDFTPLPGGRVGVEIEKFVPGLGWDGLAVIVNGETWWQTRLP